MVRGAYWRHGIVNSALHRHADDRLRRSRTSIDDASRPIEISFNEVADFDLNQIVCGFVVVEVAIPRGKSRCSPTATLNG
jgi:hypothetical protein